MDNLRQADNKVKIEGILTEMDLTEDSYSRDGKTVECIKGRIHIKTTQTINGETKEIVVPVDMFANKYTREGKINSAYNSIYHAMTEYVSQAAAPEGVEPDYVKVNGSLKMNEYISKRTKEITSFPRITASFISKVKKEEYKPEATFSIQFVVAEASYETNSEGEETGRYKIFGIVPQFGGTVDVFPFYAVSENVISAVSTYWQPGDTVSAIGKLDFSSTTETRTIEVDFGEPQEKTFTKNVSDIIITGGCQTPLDDTAAYSADVINQALAERKARLAEMKERGESGASTVKKAVPGSVPGKGINFGF